MDKLKTFLLPFALVLGALLVSVPLADAGDYRPIFRGWEIAAPGANTDALTTAQEISWESSEGARITIQVATSSVVNLMVTRSGTENALGLNGSNALEAGATYTFDVHGLQPGDLVNFQVETDSVLDLLAIGSMRIRR